MAESKTQDDPNEHAPEAPEKSVDEPTEDTTETKTTKEDKEDESTAEKPEDEGDKPEKSSESSETEVKAPEEKPKELTKDDIIKILKTFPGVGQVIAERIYDAGFDTREKLSSITIEDLKEIAGVGQAMAQTIGEGMEDAIKRFDQPEKEAKAEEKKGEGITSKAMGFVKGTFSKITGFFKGKLPKSKAKPTAPEPTTDKGVTEPASSELDQAKVEEERTEEAIKETYFPEVGKSAEEYEPPTTLTEVKVEGGETEGVEAPADITVSDSNTERTSELEREPTPGPDQKSPGTPAIPSPPVSTTPEINLRNSSGLLMWFETTPNLRPEAGKLLFKAGYNNLDELKDAVVEDLTMVNGISENEAKMIYDELRKLY
ncbi:helix-hairpin-helix domain-containing protein [[Eubacterium] cellulosolvens]